MTTRDTRLRADAARNRERVLDAARAAFANEGTGVSMAEIVRRAGVGFATAQRRFPTKDDLVREIVAEELADLTDALARGAADGDPWEVLTAHIRACAAHQARHPGLASAIVEALDASASSAGRLAEIFTGIVRRAADAGVLRHDIALADLLAILKGNVGVIDHSPGAEAAASARFIDLALRGLRTD